MVLSFILSIVVILVDQITKTLFYGLPSKSIIGNLIWFESAFNTGIAFSMFKDNVPFFIIISSVSCILFVFLIINKKIIKNKPEKICLGVILGGAFSNLIDRVIFKGVRDFIYLKFIDFAIFNIADMAVSFGLIIFCIFYLINEIKEYQLDPKMQNIDKNSKIFKYIGTNDNQNLYKEKILTKKKISKLNKKSTIQLFFNDLIAEKKEKYSKED